MNPPKYYFCTFADFGLLPSLLRIRKQAKNMRVFTECKVFTQCSLTKKAKINVRAIIKRSHSKKGYGYWSWKTYVIGQMFSQMNYDDVLLYCDAGCELNHAGVRKLAYYFDLTNKNDICAVQLPECQSDINYTKKDTLNYFNNLSYEIMKQGQVQATAFFIKKSSFTIELVKKWSELMSVQNLHLFDDSPSAEPEHKDFMEHRHDQSIFSCLLKSTHFYPLPLDNFWVEEGQWQKLYENEPVLFKRNKVRIKDFVKQGIKSKIKKVINFIKK